MAFMPPAFGTLEMWGRVQRRIWELEKKVGGQIAMKVELFSGLESRACVQIAVWIIRAEGRIQLGLKLCRTVG